MERVDGLALPAVQGGHGHLHREGVAPHHSTTLNSKGDSYRLKEQRKAGLLGSTPKPRQKTAAA